MSNRGTGKASHVIAELNNWPANVTVIDGDVDWAEIPAGDTVTSGDTFTLRIDRRISVSNDDLSWILEFDDEAGTHYRLVNFPIFP